MSKLLITRKRIIVFLTGLNLCLFASYVYLVMVGQPVAVIVPHHDIVKHKRLEFLKQIAEKRPITQSVIILSPDHFSPNQYVISYSDKIWNLSNGNLEYDNLLGNKITGFLSKNNGVVASDHGIYNLLPDIKEVWPKAKVVPIIIGQRIKLVQLDSLINQINENCQDSCLLIASVDFSHYLPKALADVHDAKSLTALTNGVTAAISDLEVDSQQALYVVNVYTKLKNAGSWNLHDHSNSGEILDSRDIESTSHFFGWYDRQSNLKQSFASFTFLAGRKIELKRDKDTLGERFFYGVDDFNGDLSESFSPRANIIIEPSQSSVVQKRDGILRISLGEDLIVGGFTYSDKTTIIFLPLSTIGDKKILTRGEEKTKYFRRLFSNIDQGDVYKLDINNGEIIL